MRWLALIAVVAGWFWLGDPPKTVANWFWPDDRAPWETIDAFYYPDQARYKYDQMSRFGLYSLDECRSWVYDIAAQHGDPNMLRSSYECGIGFIEVMIPGDPDSPRIYRITAE